MNINLEKILQEKFGLENFREWQKEIIESILQWQDTLVFMPTGGGKSLTYQFPGIIRDGIVLVISPLISLMKDQVDKLNNLNIPTEQINSTIDYTAKQYILADITSKTPKTKFLYIAPERLMSQDFLEAISHTKIALIAIDEAHCISQWWHDFRPSYMKIRDFLTNLRNKNNQIFPIIALTATATKKVKKDIIERLGISHPKIFTTGFDRKNLILVVREISKKEEKNAKLLEILDKTPWNGIIYCSSVKSCKEVFEFLQEKNISSAMYTGEMTGNIRENVQNNFMNSEYKVIVATNAFGMGIDKKDIRFVIHYNLPWSIENYYQEVGRAGRDGKNSFGIVLASFSDTKIQEFFIENSYPSKEDILKFYDYLYNNFEYWQGSNEKILQTYYIMAAQSGIKNDMQVGAILRIFEKYNILKRWIDDENIENFHWRGVTLLINKMPHSALPIDWTHQNLLKTEAYFKLGQIKKLLFYPSCRKKFILEYFGDEEDITKIADNCWTCDFCIDKRKMENSEQKEIVKISVFALALETVLDLNERFGITMISKILHGNTDKKILENHLDEEENFGILSNYSIEMISAILETLLSQNFLYKTEGNYPILGVTSMGRNAIRNNNILEKENKELQFYLEKRIPQKKYFSEKIQKPKKIPKIDTFTQTLDLWKIHKNIEKIAKIRELTKQTIEGHCIELYKNNLLSLQEILSLANFEHLKVIKNFLEKNSEENKLSIIKAELENMWYEKITYFEIKIACTLIEKKAL